MLVGTSHLSGFGQAGWKSVVRFKSSAGGLTDRWQKDKQAAGMSAALKSRKQWDVCSTNAFQGGSMRPEQCWEEGMAVGISSARGDGKDKGWGARHVRK